MESKPLVCIETYTGRQVRCTSEHPILTEHGYVTAGKLTGTDKIMDFEHGYVDIKAIYSVNHQNVINFSVCPMRPENKACIICDYIVTGDMEEQYHCVESENKTLELIRINKQISEETMKLQKFFEK